MTTQQQNIIDSLKAEFERINTASTGRKAFNLIDTGALQDKTRLQREWKRLEEEDNATWKKAAEAETWRVMALLIEDLPDYVRVEKYNTSIGKYEASQFQIRHESVHHMAHHEELVTIEVIVRKQKKVDDHGNAGDFGSHFEYKPHPMLQRANGIDYLYAYKTIEEAVNDPYFKEALRNRVISRIVR